MTSPRTKIPAMERVAVGSGMDFAHDLQFYEEAPVGSLDFEDLRELIIDRLLILRMVMKIAEANANRSPRYCRRKLVEELRASRFETFADLCDGTGHSENPEMERREARRRDHLSQYTLLACMSQSDDTRFRIEEAELHLFRWRLSALDSRGILRFKSLNKLPYSMVSENEKKILRPRLKRAMKHASLIDQTDFYEVPALEMLEARRHVYLRNGIAYATDFQLPTAFLFQYETRLQSRIRTWRSKKGALVDPRVQALRKSVGRIFKLTNPAISHINGPSIDDLDAIAEISYPPCMRRLHEGLRKTHHLRYQGRLQYTINLKSMGIPAESALELYRREFTRIIDDEAFEKRYAYGFLHMYGLKGSRINYPVPKCRDIAEETPGQNEFHGCPLATPDIEDLGKRLVGWNVEPSGKYEIVDMAKKRRRAAACARYFEATHNRPISRAIETPMDFYTQSRTIRHDEDANETINAKPGLSTPLDDDESDESESSEDYDSEDDSADNRQNFEANNLSAGAKNDFQTIEINNLSAETEDDCQIIEENNSPAESEDDCQIIEIDNSSAETENDCQIIEVNNPSSETDDDCQIIKINTVSVETETRKAPGTSTIGPTEDEFLRDWIFELYRASGHAK